MIRKKSSIWTFIWSLIPGAGEMYLGFMKRGLSLMVLAFGIFMLCIWSYSLGFLAALLPVIWFYSFFSVNNIKSMPDDEFYALEDEFILIGKEQKFFDKNNMKKYYKLFAVVLILFGAMLVWNNCISLLSNLMPDYLYDIIGAISNFVPQLVIGIGIIIAGCYLIKGKKEELKEADREKNTYALGEIEDKGGV